MKTLPDFSRSAPVFYLDETISTNSLLKSMALEGAEEGTVLIAGKQSGGRGRMERVFSSPEGGLYLSMLLRPDCPPEQSLSLTPCTAVAVHRAIKGLCGISPGIKWPNDLMYKGKKLCGILCESLFFQGRQLLVLGIGLNVRSRTEDLPEELRGTAGSLLSLLGEAPSVEQTARELICRLDEMYGSWCKDRGCYLEEYRRHCVSTGRPVSLIRNGELFPAYGLDIDDDYALVAEFPDGTRESISYGEVSLR